MFRIFGMEKSALGRMCINPEIHEDARRNHLDRVALHFRKMLEAGHREAVVAQIAEFAALVGMELVAPDSECQPEGKPVQEELLDIHPAIVEHAQAIRRRDPLQAVEAWERESVRQIKQATNAYREECA